MQEIVLDLENNSKGDIKILGQALHVKNLDQMINSVRQVVERGVLFIKEGNYFQSRIFILIIDRTKTFSHFSY